MGQRSKVIASADFAVIGAGSFGSWTALTLARRGYSVVLADGHGAANARASSGGETRIIRMSYGVAAHYTEMSWQSLPEWKSLRAGEFFVPCGALFTARAGNKHLEASYRELRSRKIPVKRLGEAALRKQYPQVRFEPGSEGLLEPSSGVLLARRATQFVVRQAGIRYLPLNLRPETAHEVVRASRGYIWACGPWLPSLFPAELGNRIWPTRQDVFFFGSAPGDCRFGPEELPAWVDFSAEIYTVPDVENRGFKAAFDRHGPAFDPENGSRVVGPAAVKRIREAIRRSVPELAEAPIVETRVCQYENTSDGEFLIDWLSPGVMVVGGGSGHGFKHGPAVGAYVADLAEGKLAKPNPVFSLASKGIRQARQVY
jgi:sarcosine oxidase